MDNNIILEPKVKIPFFVLLHRLGHNETDLLFLKDILPENSLLLLIRGPREWKTQRNDGYCWFNLLGNKLGNFSKEDDIEMSSNYIDSIVKETIQKYSLLDDPIFIGVSQGGVVALHACIDHKIKCKAIVSLLGFYEFKLKTDQISNTPILMINGLSDHVIPFDWSQKSYDYLKIKNKNITSVFLNSGHEVTNEMIDICMSWIHKLTK